jgi:hypothetical protein
MKPKKERNKLIVKLIDKGWSMQEVATEMKFKAKSTVHEIYWREKRRSDREKVIKKLSTDKTLTPFG